MIKFLSQPYPLTLGFKKMLKTNIFIGIFIGLFLIIFQPFGNENWQPEFKTLKLAGYGFISFLMPTLLFFAIRLFKIPLKEDRWTTGKEALWMIGILFFIALGNIYYSYLLGISNFSINSFVGSLLIVVVIGIFPIMTSILVKYNRYKKLNQNDADVIRTVMNQYNSNTIQRSSTQAIDNAIILLAENNKDTLTVNATDILYLESADNYTKIVYLEKNTIRKELLRGSLTKFENQIEQPIIVRCHRSYVINLSKVLEISGNAQGYQLRISDSDKVIPVARNYGKDILSLLKKSMRKI